ncbi:MAG: sigma-54 dependent transcriptional regulator [Acidobacteriota bacterium]
MAAEGNGHGLASRLIGDSPAMAEVMDTLDRVAKSNATVLITGESGTGKSMLARHLHQVSPRRDGPFVGISCANISEGLLESELFGHEKGAFTGAQARKLGKFEQATGGTLFIDSVGDLQPGLQAKLLRVLQERVVERLGGSGPIPIDVRIIASALEGLDRMIEKELFRKDLYYRLNVVPVCLPPLRRRREDIPQLAEQFLAEVTGEQGGKTRRLSGAAKRKLQSHRWPGNLRELRNVIERATIASDRTVIGPGDLQFAGPFGPVETIETALEEQMTLGQLEAIYIRRILKLTGGNQSAAARVLGIHRKTLLEKRKRYGISANGKEEEPR